MRSKEFITELSMAPGNLMKFALLSSVGKNMRAGFEAELIVPGTYTGDEDSTNINYNEDRTLPSTVDMSDIADFFVLSHIDRNYARLEEEYLEWIGEQASYSIDENISERIEYLQEQDPELDDDDAHDKAWDQLEHEYHQGDAPDLYDFFRDNNLRTFLEVSERFNLDWPYFLEDNTFEDEVSSYVETLGDHIGANIKISNSYHGNKKEFAKGYWYIEPDGSILPDNLDYMGIEVVSPPMPILTMLDNLSKTLEWAKQQGAKTNTSTGLHVGVSLAGQTTKNLDYVKLVLFLGDKYVLERFGRAASSFTTSSLYILNKKIAYSGREINISALDQLKRGLALEASKSIQSSAESRNVSVNIRPDYVEFRSMGSDYLNHYDAIQNTILRYVRAFAVASDPMAERQEYFKKLSKLLNPSNSDQLGLFVRYASGQLDKTSLVNALKDRFVSKKTPLVAPEQQPQEPENLFNPNSPS